MPKRWRWPAIAGGTLLAVLAGFFVLRGRQAEAQYVTAAVDRGDVAEIVGATGTLQAVTTVQVGSQVSGTIQNLYADFNSTVRKDQVLARLDPSLFQARLGQAQANLISARANVDRARASADDMRQKYTRAQELSAEKLLSQSDLDTARANHEAAVAQVKANQAAVSQAAAAVNQAQVDLRHTVISAPIDGIVIARNVDVGQTVAASLQAPVLFVIANDLSHMQVKASIDEADVGRVRAGQAVTFRVDSFPERTFRGQVEQVRLQPTTVQNVVTYDAIIAVDNVDQRLMPGMTATVSIIVRQSQDVLRVPAAALRFRPAGFEAPARGPGTRSPAAGGAASPRAEGGGAAGAGGGGRRRFGGQGGPGGGEAARARRSGFSGGTNGDPAAGASAARGAGEVRPSLLFVMGADGEPQPMRVRVGISDGQYVEVRDGLQEGTRVITGLEVPGTRTAARPASPAAANPFAPPQPQRRQR